MTPERFAVVVTGSRDLDDSHIEIIDERLMRYPRGTILLHGAAPGADMLADGLGANVLRHHPVPHPYFSHLGTRGGHARNALLVALACVYASHGYTVVVEAFPMGESRGTRGCIEKARAAGLAVVVTEMTP